MTEPSGLTSRGVFKTPAVCAALLNINESTNFRAFCKTPLLVRPEANFSYNASQTIYQ